MLCVLANSPGATAQETPEQSVQTGPGHHFAAADYTGQKVFLVNADGEVEWEYENGGACNDIWVLPMATCFSTPARA